MPPMPPPAPGAGSATSQWPTTTASIATARVASTTRFRVDGVAAVRVAAADGEVIEGMEPSCGNHDALPIEETP
jgi:hypothetical protein